MQKPARPFLILARYSLALVAATLINLPVASANVPVSLTFEFDQYKTQSVMETYEFRDGSYRLNNSKELAPRYQKIISFGALVQVVDTSAGYRVDVGPTIGFNYDTDDAVERVPGKVSLVARANQRLFRGSSWTVTAGMGVDLGLGWVQTERTNLRSSGTAVNFSTASLRISFVTDHVSIGPFVRTALEKQRTRHSRNDVVNPTVVTTEFVEENAIVGAQVTFRLGS